MYYPKSQIKTNLYTNGDEYVIESTQIPYTGYYYLTSTGKAFTGKTPDDKPNQELIPVEPVVKDEGEFLPLTRNLTTTIFSSHNPGAIESVTSLDYNSALNYAQLKENVPPCLSEDQLKCTNDEYMRFIKEDKIKCLK